MKLFKLTLVALCAFDFMACGLGTPSPTEVFKAHAEAQKKKDTAAMKQNLSKASLELIEKAAKAENKSVDEALAAESPMGNQNAEYEFKLALDKFMQELMKKMTDQMKMPTGPSNTNSADK